LGVGRLVRSKRIVAASSGDQRVHVGREHHPPGYCGGAGLATGVWKPVADHADSQRAGDSSEGKLLSELNSSKNLGCAESTGGACCEWPIPSRLNQSARDPGAGKTAQNSLRLSRMICFSICAERAHGVLYPWCPSLQSLVSRPDCSGRSNRGKPPGLAYFWRKWPVRFGEIEVSGGCKSNSLELGFRVRLCGMLSAFLALLFPFLFGWRVAFEALGDFLVHLRPDLVDIQNFLLEE